MTEDRNFDDIAHKFAKNIYGSDKGEIRQIIVWEDFLQILSELGADHQALQVLDAGGGLAQMSQKLAKLGHHVALCDLSSEMLQLAKQDIVMFHAVMEWLVDPKTALETVLEQVKPGGIASVMFYNHHGLVYKNVVCGNIPHVLDGMPHRKRFKLQPQKGLKPEEVYQWIEDSGFSICGKSGIRSFSDYIGNMEYMGDYEFEDVLALEKQLCRQEPYLSLGRYIHVWAKKNDKQEYR